MSDSYRLRYSKSGARQYNVARRSKVYPVAWGNENWFYSRSCPQTKSNHLIIAVLIRAECTSFICRRNKREKRRLSASDGRNIQNDAYIRGQSHLPWMGNPISIYQRDIGLSFQFSEGSNKRNPLTEIQESWNIRNPDLSNFFSDLDNLKLWIFLDDDNSPYKSFFILIAKICASDVRDISDILFQDKMRSQSPLDISRFLQIKIHVCGYFKLNIYRSRQRVKPVG